MQHRLKSPFARRVIAVFSSCIAVAVLAGCPPATESSQPDFHVIVGDVDPVPPGGSGIAPLLIVRENGWTGAVTLSQHGQSGAVVYSDVTIPADVGTYALPFTVLATAQQTSQGIVISGMGPGLVYAPRGLGSVMVIASGSFLLGADNVAFYTTPLTATTFTTTINVVRNGPAQAIALSLTGVPSALDVTLSKTSLNASETSATISIAVGTSVPEGNYQATLVASSPGAPDRSIIFSVFIHPKALSSTLLPRVLSITAGQSGTATVTVTRANYGPDVTVLGIVPANSSIVASASPATLQTTNFNAVQTSQLTVAAGIGVPQGAYSLIVTVRGILPPSGSTIVPEVLDTITVLVSAPAAIASMTLAPTAIAMNVGDASVALSATLKDAGGQPTAGTLNWTSDGPTIASVAPGTTPIGTTTAQVSAVAPGLVAVTAANTASGVFARSLVRVAGTSGVARIVVSPFHLSFTITGTHQYTAQSYNKLGVEIIGSSVAWESSNPAVASVDPVSGVVTANAIGGAIITARRDGQYSTGAVTVGGAGAIKGTLVSTSGQYLAGARATARQGGVIVGAGVVTVDPGTNQFYLPGLPAGVTQVTIDATGFASQVVTATVVINQVVVLGVVTFP